MEILIKEEDCVYIVDEGLTEISEVTMARRQSLPENSLTTIAFYPSTAKRFELFQLL